MKITDPNIIRNSETELIDAITADIDWGAIEKIFRDEHKLNIEEDVEYKKGDIVVHDNQVAYKLEFQVNVIMSVLLDRDGNCLSVNSSGDLGPNEQENEAVVEEDLSPEELSGDTEPEGMIDENVHEEPTPEMEQEQPGAETSDNNEKNDDKIDTENPDDMIAQMASEAGDMISELQEH